MEAQFRQKFPTATPYWEGGKIAFDSVRYEDGERIVVSELKLSSLSKHRRNSLLKELQEKVANSRLSKKYSQISCEVLDFDDLAEQL